MDLKIITVFVWNMVLLLLFFLPGTLFEATETNNKEDTKKHFELDAIETKGKLASLAPSILSEATKPTETIMLLSVRKTTTAATIPTTAKSIKFLFSLQNAKNYTTKQEKLHSHYREIKKIPKNMETTADNSHEIFKSNTATEATTTGSAIARHVVDDHQKQEQQTKLLAISATDFKNNSYDAHSQPAIVHDNTKTLKNTSKTLLQAGALLSIVKLTKTNTQNSLATAFTSQRFVNFHKDQQILEQLAMSNRSSINEIDDPHVLQNNINNMLELKTYDGNGQAENTSSTKTLNRLNKSKPPTVVSSATPTTTTTRKPLTLAAKQNHMYDNNSALTYLPYKSAALKASASVMKTLNNNFSNTSSGINSSSLKRATLLSHAGIKSTAKASAADNYFTRNSSNSYAQNAADDDTTLLNMQYYFKSNNSLVYNAALTMKQTAATIMNATARAITTSNTITAIATNATSSSSSSLPFNILSTYSVTTAPTTTATREIPTTAATFISTTSTSRTTLKNTTQRRKIATTTLKPPPTIDDYQTITSQAGTHAYLPCNVKQLVKKPISWLRVRDGHILTVDQTTFIADQRFQSVYTINPERWSLQIKYVQLKDAGIYECQVSTEPKASAIVYLHVVEPKTELIGAPTRHVKAGSQVKLLCIISQALEPPLFINWFHNQKQIYLHNRKGWHTEIERIELPPETTTTTTTTTTTKRTTTTTTKTTTSAPTTSTVTSMPSLTSPLFSSSASSSSASSSLTFSSTNSSTLNGSEISAMHKFTTTTIPQHSLKNVNLLELISESTYNSSTNLIQPKVERTSTPLKTENNQTTTTAASVDATLAPISIKTTLPTTTTSPSSFNDITDDNNNDNNDDGDDNDNGDDFKINPSLSTFETAEAIAASRGYMMLSSLMTFTDVKQITTASLIIPSVQKQDSGNYTCSPSNSEPRTVILHVLNGEYSASAITSNALNLHVQFKFFIFNLSILTLIDGLLSMAFLYKQHVIKSYSGG